jgi:alpha-ketoglutarate-dependent taurine dioxygenase
VTDLSSAEANNQSTGVRRSIKAARQRASAPSSLITASTLHGTELPLIVRPSTPGVDLAAWAASEADRVEAWILEHGAVLFRGFGLRAPSEFEAVVSNLVPELFGEYGDLPKEEDGQRIYHSTPYPNDMAILFHNESSHLPDWPNRQFFFCVQPSLTGGNTPLLDCERVMEHIDADVLDRFATKRLCYVRNFIPGVDVSWQDFFKTDDPGVVERLCAAQSMTCEWIGDTLRVKHVTEAIRTHPTRGTPVFFNQVQLHHSSCLDPGTRSALLEICGSEIALPRNVVFGDDTPIPDTDMAHLDEVFFEQCVQLPWEAGDIIALDNMRVSHARLPYEGPRKITVAMARMHSHEQLQRTGSAA